MRKFRIAVSSKIGGFGVLGEKSKVSEDMFWNLVEQKCKEITADRPEAYNEVFNKVKQHLLKGESKYSKNDVIVVDTWFEVRGCTDV